MGSPTSLGFLFYFFSSVILSSFCCCRLLSDSGEGLTLDSLRESLIRQEDSIVFSLIERAKYPQNSPNYDPSYLGGFKNFSLVEIFVRETEKVQAKAGRYQNPEELPFFSEYVPLSLVPPYNYPKVLYPAAATTNVSKTIWDMYFNYLLPQFTAKGDDGNYAVTSASDLVCLQVLSRRIHYGRFVAEVKFQAAPQDYIAAIQAKDENTLMSLVTSKSVEEMNIQRVEKKAMVFGQNVTLDSNNTCTGGSQTTYKVDPLVVSRLYENWVIPLTKRVEIEYLLHRLD